MANSGPDEARDYNTKIIEEFRANEGRVGGPWAGIPLILIHHVGAKSGIERVTPLPPTEDRQPTPTGADPPGLTWSARLRIGVSDSGHLTGIRGTWPGQAAPACPACTTT